MKLRDVVIASAVRTAGGSFGGSLKPLACTDLGGVAIKVAVKKSGIDPEFVEQVILGNGWQAGVGPNPARIATINSGLSESCPAFTVNIRCGSGLRSIQLGALSIAAGETEVVIAGGMESASNAPYILPDARWGARMGKKELLDVLQKDGFMCSLAGMMMGGTGELLAEKYNISRREQDVFALSSHEKAVKAIAEGVFIEEIAPVEVQTGKSTIVFDTDEIPRADSSLEKMEKLQPIFKENGTITAANSSALCDGASAIVLASGEVAKKLGIKPLARILSYSFIALAPEYMGEGPIKAVPKALAMAGLTMDDIDLFELNEAFAVQALACQKALRIDPSKLNIYGGAIALGHPVGATGAKLLTTLAYQLRHLDKRYGVVTLCIGGGQGVAMVIENIN